MDYGNMTLGQFIINKRKERDLSVIDLAIGLSISTEHMCDYEKDRKPLFNYVILDKIKMRLSLSEEEAKLMYDLAAMSKYTANTDLSQLIMDNELVRVALRTAKRKRIPDEKWKKFIEEASRREIAE